jgi:hypothetical protein
MKDRKGSDCSRYIPTFPKSLFNVFLVLETAHKLSLTTVIQILFCSLCADKTSLYYNNSKELPGSLRKASFLYVTPDLMARKEPTAGLDSY